MKNLSKKIEVAANVAIIVVAILLGAVLVRRYLLPASPPPSPTEAARIKPGTKLSLPGVDWGGSSRTLLMVLSTNCRYCTESAPFYQRLAREKAGRPEVRLLAVLPQPVEESKKYLGDHGVAADDVRQTSPGALGVAGTPTLVLVDKTGAVVESWVGKLPPATENEVVNRLLAAPAAN